jgi:hypothetical protein
MSDKEAAVIVGVGPGLGAALPGASRQPACSWRLPVAINQKSGILRLQSGRMSMRMDAM